MRSGTPQRRRSCRAAVADVYGREQVPMTQQQAALTVMALTKWAKTEEEVPASARLMALDFAQQLKGRLRTQ